MDEIIIMFSLTDGSSIFSVLELKHGSRTQASCSQVPSDNPPLFRAEQPQQGLCFTRKFVKLCRTRLMESLPWSRLLSTVICSGPTAQLTTSLKTCQASRLPTLEMPTWGLLTLALTCLCESSEISYLRRWWAGKSRTNKTLQMGRRFLEYPMSLRLSAR